MTNLRALQRYRPYAFALAGVLLITLVPSRGDGQKDRETTAAVPAAAALGGADAPAIPAIEQAASTGGATRRAGAGPVPAAARSATASTMTVAPPVGSGARSAEALAAPDCDAGLKRIKVPTKFAPSCVRPWSKGADNGGATAAGITGDTITLALPLTGDTGQQREDNKRNWQLSADMYEAHYRTWGRKVKVVWYDPCPSNAAGVSPDEACQRAKAIEIQNLKPFAAAVNPTFLVQQTELAARGILVLGESVDVDTSRKLAPFLWGFALPADEFAVGVLGEYAGKRLAGQPAKWAGDPAMQAQPRKFGLIYAEGAKLEVIREQFARYGVQLAETVSYPRGQFATYQERSRVMVSKLKNAGVTTIVNGSDLFATPIITKEATAQLYRPEWLITGTFAIDVSLFGRLNDQEQWRHAFGLGVQAPHQAKHRTEMPTWHYGSGAAAETFGSVAQLLYRGIHLAGPALTPQTFQAGLFAEPPSGGAACGCVTIYQGSFGGWGATPGMDDYSWPDDYVEQWWDPDYIGTEDVTGAPGQGSYRYVDGGKRYMAGQLPSTPPRVFDRNRSPAGAEMWPPPPQDNSPSYPCEGCPSGAS